MSLTSLTATYCRPMTPTVAISQLRAALAVRGVSTRDDDVRTKHSCYSTLSLGRLKVTCGLEYFRWHTGSREWRWHPASDPAGAAERLVAALLAMSGHESPSPRSGSSALVMSLNLPTRGYPCH
ncbi:hypothetical protein GCM10009733_007980 [Nonomuraea maheshkhaliensis]|uniref:Uncharacterized protein n=1 Tax=Nonomuraea maheshkhaliensis TaxID=419590 RepID=A0ABN2EQ11_9ACTN